MIATKLISRDDACKIHDRFVFNNHCTLYDDAICLMVRQRSDVMAYLPGRPRLRLLRNPFLPVPASESLSIFRLLLSLSGGDVRLWISIGRFARWIVSMKSKMG